MAFKPHPNGGGLVEDTAYVEQTAYVGPKAVVRGRARVPDHSRIEDHLEVSDRAEVLGKARVRGNALTPLRRLLCRVWGVFSAIHKLLERWRIALPLYFVLLGVFSIMVYPPTAQEITAASAERTQGGGGGLIALPRSASGKGKSGRLVANMLQRNGILRRSKATKVPSISLFRRSYIRGSLGVREISGSRAVTSPALTQQIGHKR